MEEKLKPCPFCGKSVNLEWRPQKTRSYRGTFRDIYCIKCYNCGISTFSSMFKSEVIEAWNTRVEGEKCDT